VAWARGAALVTPPSWWVEPGAPAADAEGILAMPASTPVASGG